MAGEVGGESSVSYGWKSHLIWLVVCSIALAGGYALGQRAAPGSSDDVVSSDAVDGAPAAPRGLLEVLGDRDEDVRAEWLARELPRMGPESLPDIERAIHSVRLNLGAVEYVLLTRALSAHDPEQAYEWALRDAPAAYRDAALMAAVEGWARQDPLAAVEAIASVPAGDTRDLVLISLVRGWYASGQPDLEQYIADLGLGLQRQWAMAAYVRAMMEGEGSDALMTWAEELSDDDSRLKQVAFVQVAMRLGISDPPKAIEWEARHGAGPYGDLILDRVVGGWVLVDGPAAMAWLSGLAPGERRDKGVQHALKAWRDHDRAEMLAWVAGIGPEGVEPWLQPGVGVVAMAVARRDPEAAIEWADAMESNDDRHSAYVAIALRWRKLDAAAAAAWVAQSDLSEEQKANASMDVEPRRNQRRAAR